MAVESAGCPYVKVPVPIQGAYSVSETAILLRVSRNAAYEWSLLEDDPLPLRRMMGRGGALRVQGGVPRVEQTARDVSGVVEKIDLAGGIVTRFGDGA